MGALLMYLYILSVILLGNAFLSGWRSFLIYLPIIAGVVLLLNLEGARIAVGSASVLLRGLVYGIGLITAIFLAELGFGWISVAGFNPHIDLLTVLTYIVFQTLVAVGEEISFRGYILTHLVKNVGIGGAISLSSILFAAIHIPSIMCLDIGLIGGTMMLAVLGLFGFAAAHLFLRYGILAAIGFHLGWNFFQYNVYSLSYSAQGIFDTRYLGGELLTGAQYGPEAGLLALTLFLMVALRWHYIKSQHTGDHNGSE
jgi:membrane protease YdiL (CAAX protease family)